MSEEEQQKAFEDEIINQLQTRIDQDADKIDRLQSENSRLKAENEKLHKTLSKSYYFNKYQQLKAERERVIQYCKSSKHIIHRDAVLSILNHKDGEK